MQRCSFLVCFFLTLGATSWAQGDQKIADEQDDFELVQTRRLKFDTSTADEEQAPCQKWCGANPQPWTTKCTWTYCKGCGDCIKVNPTAAPKPETTLTSGTHFLDNRPKQDIIVLVPAGDGPLPVFIVLHGAGGLSANFCRQFQDTPGHIVVCPKRNNQDDLVFVGKELLNWLADFSNVDPTSFKLAGFSQGGDSTNRIAIGSDDPRITHLVTFTSQLHVRQYHDGHFWTEEGEITKKDQIHGRKLLQFTGLKDTVCQCCDASKKTCGGNLVTWEESAYRYAQAWGYTGSQMTPVETDDSYSVSYLDGQVQAFNIKKAGHRVPFQQWARLAPDFFKVNPTAAPKPETTLTSGTHFLDNRPKQDIIVLVPAGDGPLPVFIALHGAGGLSSNFCRQFQDTPGHIVVCPKRNNQDDLVFVGKELLNWLADFSNVDPTSFKLAGYSQGGDRTNRIAIGNDDPRITHLVTFMSQLHVRQYHSGHFWTEDGEITKKDQIHGRKLLQFTGLRDTRCLCCDASKETCGGKLVTWEESAYRYAQAWGYTSSQMTPVETDDSYSVSYLDGQVQAFNIKKAGHSLKGAFQQWARLAPDFFGTPGAKPPK